MKQTLILDKFLMKLLTGVLTSALIIYILYDTEFKYFNLIKEIDLKSISFIHSTLLSVFLGTILIFIGYFIHSISTILIKDTIVPFIQNKVFIQKFFFLKSRIDSCIKYKNLFLKCMKDIRWGDISKLFENHESILRFATSISYQYDTSIHANRGSSHYAIYEFLCDIVLLDFILIIYFTFIKKYLISIILLILAYFILRIAYIYYYASYKFVIRFAYIWCAKIRLDIKAKAYENKKIIA